MRQCFAIGLHFCLFGGFDGLFFGRSRLFLSTMNMKHVPKVRVRVKVRVRLRVMVRVRLRIMIGVKVRVAEIVRVRARA